ncbi:hypothetical protein PC116_g23889, partial [Phytophthora cactorum]
YSYLPFVVLLAFFFLLSLKLVPETSNKSADEVLRVRVDWKHDGVLLHQAK